MNFDLPQKHSHELVLFFYPSPGLNWMNPRAITFSTAWNKLLGLPRGIGHVSVMIRTPKSFLLTGMTQSHKHEGRKEVLFGGYGLGILLHNFAGALEQPESLAPELVKRSRQTGKLSYFRVSVNEKITDRLFQYIEEYRKNNYHQWYGMKNRPLYGEGSGCSAFGASFLEVAGLLHEDYFREWTRTFNIPHDLIGGPITGKSVSVVDLLRRADRWAQDSEPHEKGFFWDPDLMHEWLVKNHFALQSPEKMKPELSTEMWNLASGIHLDAKMAPAPSGAIFKHLEEDEVKSEEAEKSFA